ncbi:hypothetical protein PG988_007420 [Apiospora saccharicola]
MAFSAGRATRKLLRYKYPHTYAERKAEARSEARAAQDITDDDIEIDIGNYHQDVTPIPGEQGGDTTHDWTLFIRPSRPGIIEEVHICLDPTLFPQETVVLRRAPYEISRQSRVSFLVKVAVVLKSDYSWVTDQARDAPDGVPNGTIDLEWLLDFDSFGGRGSMGRYRIKFRNDRDAFGIEEMIRRDVFRVLWRYEQQGRIVWRT